MEFRRGKFMADARRGALQNDAGTAVPRPLGRRRQAAEKKPFLIFADAIS